jgi:3-deoxy-D-manno-octulosonic-acid transferase
VANARELGEAVAALLVDRTEAQRLGRLGRDIVAENRGALQRLLRLLEPLIADVGGR